MSTRNHEQSRRQKIHRDFVKYCAGRLFWRDKFPKWKQWQSADIARIKDAQGVNHVFTSLDQIEEYIIDCLKYPDDTVTRDFSNGHAERRKKIKFMGAITFGNEEETSVIACPNCGKNEYIRVIVDFTQANNQRIYHSFRVCVACNVSDNDILRDAYWYLENAHDL